MYCAAAAARAAYVYICTAAVEPVLLISLFLLRPSSSWQSASSRQHTCTLECEATQCKTFQGKVSLEAALWTKHAMHASLLSSYTKRLDGSHTSRELSQLAGEPPVINACWVLILLVEGASIKEPVIGSAAKHLS